MKKFLGISLGVGLITGLVALISSFLNIPSWMLFLGWSVSFFTGANWEGVKKSFPCLILGPILAYLTNFVLNSFDMSVYVMAIIVAILGFFMTYSQTSKLFPVTAAVFTSANIYFASNNLLFSIILPLLGLLLGPPAISLGNWFDKLINKTN